MHLRFDGLLQLHRSKQGWWSRWGTLRLPSFLQRLTLNQQFMLASLVILVSGMGGIGAWVGEQISNGVVHRTAATTALYVDSFVAPELQDLAKSSTITPEHVSGLNQLLSQTPLGHTIAAFKVWDANGRVIYSTEPANIGRVFPVQGGLARAWQGQVAARISDLQDEENFEERSSHSQLLEVYSPVRRHGTDQILAVAEFYQTVDDLQKEITAAQQSSWFLVGIATLIMYLLLTGWVRGANDVIIRQQGALHGQVDQLKVLLAQNAALHKRVQQAAVRTTALTERFLRRTSAELHDGPAQDLGLALLRLDHVMADYETCQLQERQSTEDLDVIQQSLIHAMQEVRAISAGLGLPQLESLTLPETLMRVTRAHEWRTKSKVVLRMDDLPSYAPLSVKITLYRIIQEALNNAYRHAGGIGQQVRVYYNDTQELFLEVIDQGPGFDQTSAVLPDAQLGLVGIHERVASLGGDCQIDSELGRGTTVSVHLPLTINEQFDE